MRTVWSGVVLVAALGMIAPGCSSEPKTVSQQEAESKRVDAALAEFKYADPTLQALLDKAAGYAVLPEIGKAGAVIGGAYGTGEVFEGGRRIGWCEMSQGNVGLTLGAQTYREILVFVRQEDLNKFKDGQFSFAADASAVAIKSGAAGARDPSKGTIVFTKPIGGLMAEASIGGQNFKFRPM